MAVTVVLTGTTQSVTATTGLSSILVASTTGWVIGATVDGTGWAAGTKIVSFVANTSAVLSNNFTGTTGATNVIVSSNTGTVTVTLAASGDTASPQNIINAGYGLLRGNKTLEIFGSTKIILQIATGATYDDTEWVYELGSTSSLRMNESYGCGTWRSGWILVGSTYIKAKGHTINYNFFDGVAGGGKSIFFNSGAPAGYVAGTTMPCVHWNDVGWYEYTGNNTAAVPFMTYGSWSPVGLKSGRLVFDYQGDGAGANSGFGGSYGTVESVLLYRCIGGIGTGITTTSLVSIGTLEYFSLTTSGGGGNPDIKMAFPSNVVFSGFAPIFYASPTSNEYIGCNTNNTEILLDPVLPSGYNLTTQCRNYSAGTREWRRTVSLLFRDSTGAALTGVTAYIKTATETLINAVQSGDFSQGLRSVYLSWVGRTPSTGSYIAPVSVIDDRSQTVQIRKNGYIQQTATYSLQDSAYSQPFFMLTDPAYGSVTPTDATTLTGLNIDYSGSQYEISSTHNMDEVYAYGQYSLSLPANSDKSLFQSNSGGTYSLISPWSMRVISGAVTMGTYNKTINGSKALGVYGGAVSLFNSGGILQATGILYAGTLLGTLQTFPSTTSSLSLNKVDSFWTPASRADMWQIGNGATLNLTSGTTVTFSPTATLGYGTATTSEFRSGSTLNMSDSTVTYNIVSGGSGTVFSNTEAGSTWNISNSMLTLNCPNGAQVVVHAYFLPASVINNFTVNGTATNVVWQMGYTSNNSKMTGFTYGGAIFGNGTSNVLMDKYTYTGALTTIPNTFGSFNKWWWVDPKMNAGGLFRWAAGSTSTGVSGFYGVIGFRPTITMDKTGYAPRARFTASAMTTRYPSFQATTTAFTAIPLSNFFRDPTFMSGSDGFLPFLDSLDDKTVLNTIDWVADFRQAGWVDQSVTYTAATAKYGTIVSTISGAVDVNYVNATTGAADAALISVNTGTKTISSVSGTITWSPQRFYNALKNWWATYASNTNFLAATGGGYLDLGDYNTASNIRFGVTATGDALTNVRTTGLINATTNDIAVTDSRGTSTLFSFVNVLNGSTVYLVDNTGAQRLLEINTSATTYNVYIEPGASGDWIAKLRKYGYLETNVTFTPPGGGYFIGSDNVVDTYVVDTLSNVTAYTDLETSQKVYDYSSYWMTTAAGIIKSKPFAKGFGTLTGNLDWTTDPAAVDMMAVVTGVTTHTTGLNESVTLVVTGDFTQGTATLSNDVKVRANNLDSEILFSGVDSATIYATSTDALTNTSPGASSTTGIIRFKYGAALSGVTMSGTVYVRMVIGGAIQVQTLALVSGTNTLNLSTTTLLQSVIAKVDNVPTAVLAANVESTYSVGDSLRLANSVLGGKTSGAQSGVETFRDLGDTKDRLVSTVDTKGNRSIEEYNLS